MKVIALFNNKIKLFVEGRKNVFTQLENLKQKNNVIWVHTASLGEFEQGLPVIEQLRSLYPDYVFLVTFFSPSGYEIKKNSTIAEYITYLPLDTRKNATRFLNIVNPKLAVFVKYEFWPNYLNGLQQRNIPTLLVSGIFRKKQIFFKWYGGFMRNKLKAFHHFFLQNETSAALLQSIHYTNYTVCGDTRMDRVLQILERDNHLDFIATFKNNTLCVVIGSSWPEDEELLLPFINSYPGNVKFIIAPHQIQQQKIDRIKQSLNKKIVTYSQYNTDKTIDLTSFDVFIIDTIGLLTKIYSYADIAYVGGGMGTTGLHNTLEPAVFGIPVIIGKNFEKFQEAKSLVAKGGIISISNKDELTKTLTTFITNKDARKTTGAINFNFLKQNANATQTIITYIEQLNKL